MKVEKKTGLGFWEVLQIVLIALKLIGIIQWSWWLVLAPTWISLVAVVSMLIAGGIYLVLTLAAKG